MGKGLAVYIKPMSGTEILASLVCPTCRASLNDAYRCAKCGTEFPQMDGIPVLTPRPDATLAAWKNRWLGWRAQLQRENAKALAGMQNGALSGLTRRRLEKLSRAYTEQDRWVSDLLAPLGVAGQPVSPIDEVVAGRVAISFSLTGYETNLHRDWVWGDAENQASIDCLKGLGVAAPGKTLVLGAGWGRLAYDFHQTFSPTQTIAADLNPLCLLIARQLSAGRTLRLHEFPVAPRSLDQVSILRELKAPRRAGDHLHFVLSDALAPAFADGAFDTVVTPWLIDVVREDFRLFSKRINALLKPGGNWIEFGSLSFLGSDPALNYSPQETQEWVKEAGFQIAAAAEPEVPYLKCPDSRHSRRETLWAFRAVKQASVPMPAVARSVPDWLENADRSIPHRPEFTTALVTHTLFGEILRMVDGKHSVQDLAAFLTQRYQLDPARAREAVTHFLSAQVEQGG